MCVGAKTGHGWKYKPSLLNGLGGAFGAWFAGFVYDLMGSYLPVFGIMAGCILMSGVILWLAAPRKVRLVPGKRPKIQIRTP